MYTSRGSALPESDGDESMSWVVNAGGSLPSFSRMEIVPLIRFATAMSMSPSPSRSPASSPAGCVPTGTEIAVPEKPPQLPPEEP